MRKIRILPPPPHHPIFYIMQSLLFHFGEYQDESKQYYFCTNSFSVRPRPVTAPPFKIFSYIFAKLTCDVR